MRNYLLKGLALTLLLLAGPAVAERVALVIGNNAYQHGGALNSAVNDAQRVGDALQGLGFRVLRKQDLGYSGLLDALDELGRAATGADWAVVYYAGHGIQVQGKNHLIPVDVGLNREGDLRRTVLLDDLLTEVNQARELGLVILDACRDNPFAARLNQGAGRSVAVRGLARVEQTGKNTLVAFATREDTIAADTGVYAAALVQHLATPGLELRQLFGKVRDEVMARTGNGQQPYIYGSLGGGYYTFKPGSSRPPEASRDPEVVFWDSVKDSRNPAVFRIYLERYPNGTFAKLAHIRLAELEPPTEVRPGRYRDNGDGTITDTQTNLMWAARDNGSDIDWRNAQHYAANYTAGGYRNWRLPSISELRDLVDINVSPSDTVCKLPDGIYAVRRVSAPIFLSCPFLWSSETQGILAGRVVMSNGSVNWLNQGNRPLYRVLPVRFRK